ncbi:hypothetical protein OH492_07365 [Vibrio chagasii]|nr:hypothetical protein [Vibrio chagasii]
MTDISAQRRSPSQKKPLAKKNVRLIFAISSQRTVAHSASQNRDKEEEQKVRFPSELTREHSLLH